MPQTELQQIAQAILEIREELQVADPVRREELLSELALLREMALTVLDSWMEVDEAIEETIAQSEELPVSAVSEPAQVNQTVFVPDEEMTHFRTSEFVQSPITLAETWFDMSLKGDCALRKGLGYYDLHMYEQAAMALTDAVIHTDMPEARIYLALSHLATGRIDLAEHQMNVVRASSADDLTLQAVLEVEAQLCAAKEDWHGAVHVLYELLTRDSANPDIWFNLAMCHLQLYEFAAAERCLAKVTRLQPSDEEAVLWRAFAMQLTGQKEQAKAYADACHTQFQRPEFHPVLRVIVGVSVGQPQMALEAASCYSKSQPHDALGLFLYAICQFVFEQDPAAAALQCKRILTLHRDEPPALMLLGLCAYFEGELNRCLACFEAVESTAVPSPLIGLVHARALSLVGRAQDAQQRLDLLVQHRRPSVQRLAYFYRALLSLEHQRTSHADEDFARAASLGLDRSVIETAKQAARGVTKSV